MWIWELVALSGKWSKVCSGCIICVQEASSFSSHLKHLSSCSTEVGKNELSCTFLFTRVFLCFAACACHTNRLTCSLYLGQCMTQAWYASTGYRCLPFLQVVAFYIWVCDFLLQCAFYYYTFVSEVCPIKQQQCFFFCVCVSLFYWLLDSVVSAVICVNGLDLGSSMIATRFVVLDLLHESLAHPCVTFVVKHWLWEDALTMLYLIPFVSAPVVQASQSFPDEQCGVKLKKLNNSLLLLGIQFIFLSFSVLILIQEWQMHIYTIVPKPR